MASFVRTAMGTSCLALALSSPHAATDAGVARNIAALSVPFVPNHGQWDEDAAFAAHLTAGTLFVTTEGRMVYAFAGKAAPPRVDRGAGPVSSRNSSGPGASGPGGAPARRGPGWVLTETLVDGNGQPVTATPRGRQLNKGKVSYAIGREESKHRDGIATYERVDLGEVYPGIHAELRATGTNAEKIFTVEPRHDPGQIRLRVEGASRLEIGADGELIAHTGNGPVAYTAPIAFQLDAAGGRIAVAARYALNANAGSYGFDVGAWDRERPLVIDPLLQSSYLGGDGEDQAGALAIHPVTGEVYVAGLTKSTDFPKVSGAEQSVRTGLVMAFVTRFNAALTSRLQSTYLGGAGFSSASALAIHPATGEVYVAGTTDAPDFPKVAGSEQAVKASGQDVFVTRLNAALTVIIQSTYLGGNGTETARALAIHPGTGDIVVAGSTTSTDFPKVAGAEQSTKAANFDAYVTRLSSDLTTRLQSTYVGGNGDEGVNALAIHPATGEIHVAGTTTSTDFPKVTGAEQTARSGSFDAFVTRLNPALTARIQSTYLGGTGSETVGALAIHPVSGEVYVAGTTTSATFPKVAGSEQTVNVSGGDIFITRLTAALTERRQSTYLGGSDSSSVGALAIHPVTGEVYVAGHTFATDFPKVAGGDQAVIKLDTDVFVTRLNPALTARTQSTYLGGNDADQVQTMAIDPKTGDVYVAGFTMSTDFPKVAGSEQTTGTNNGDAFVSRFSLDLLAGDVLPDAFGFTPKFNVPMGSQQTTAPVQITGIASTAPISIAGGNFAQYCVSSISGCGCNLGLDYRTAPSTIADSQFVCLRQTAPAHSPAQAKTTLIVGGGWANFIVTTGTEVGPVCTLDIDGNGAQDALTDGLMIMRALFGLTGTAVTNSAVGGSATRSTWAQIQPYLNSNCGAGFSP